MSRPMDRAQATALVGRRLLLGLEVGPDVAKLLAERIVEDLRVPVLDEEWERRERAIVATGEGYDYWIRLYRAVYEAAGAVVADQRHDSPEIRRLRDALRNERRCPDDGACHHECGSGPCWRVSNCVPLSASGWEDWPEEVKRQHRDVVGIYRAALEELAGEYGCTTREPDDPSQPPREGSCRERRPDRPYDWCYACVASAGLEAAR